MPNRPLLFALATFAFLSPFAHAGAPIAPQTSDDSAVGKYGPFGLLDHRSVYGSGHFPEPLRVDEVDLDNEFRIDWLHSASGSSHIETIHPEFEKSFGPVTLEIEAPYTWTTGGAQPRQDGFENIDLGVRAPIYQYVSEDGSFDSTFGVAFEAGIPVHSSLSRNAELVPKLTNCTKLGNFTVQTVLGYSFLVGKRGDDGGLDTFEYGVVLGYSLDHRALPIPNVRQVIPIVEIVGGNVLTKEVDYRKEVSATLGVHVNLKAIGSVQPRLGAGWVVPLDRGARAEQHYGAVLSMAFDL